MKTYPEVKYFPAGGFDVPEMDLMDLTKVYYSGLYERSVTLGDGAVRTYKVYVPTTATYGDDALYMAMPDGVNTGKFLTDSGWISLVEAEENAVILVVMEPADQKWGSAETEVEYVEKVFKDAFSNPHTTLGLRSYVYINDFNHRWMGYGSGGEMIQRYAMMDPMSVTSLVILDGSEGISQEYADKAANTCFVNSSGYKYENWPNSRIPVPVWLIGAENEALIHHWRVANECTERREALADGYCYRQNPLSCNLMTFDQKVGQIRVTKSAATYLDPVLTGKIYKFLHSFARTGANSPYGNMLYNAPDDSLFQRDTILSDGMEREWYIYVPTGYTGEKPLPLVIYFHGGGQTGLIGMRQGSWWQYGEMKNFITVCPSGCLGALGDAQLPRVGWSTGNSATMRFIPRPWLDWEGAQLENRFVRAMLKKLQSQYNIDASRIYITGQSNGGVMTQTMAELGSDLFAAAASTGSNINIGHTKVPNLIYGGEWDMNTAAVDEAVGIRSDVVRDSMKDALKSVEIPYESGGYYRNGIFSNMEWRYDNGMPAYRFCCANGQAHSWRQNVSHMFWDEWFCRFSRDPETGEIKYMGR